MVNMLDWVNLAASGVLVALAVSDLRVRRLPNAMVAALAVLYGLHAFAAGAANAHALSGHAAMAVAAGVLAALLARFGWIAGGDVKLAAAVFLWAGPAHALPVWVMVSCVGFAVGLGVLGAGAAMRLDARVSRRVAWLAPERGVPYGVALASGGAAAVWWPVDAMSSARAVIGRVLMAADSRGFLAFAHGVQRIAVQQAALSFARHLGLA
ncbi:prepilin peptidase CpaA [Burkholderia multivorans]